MQNSAVPSGTVWKPLKNSDTRKRAVVSALRVAAGASTQRVTLVMVSKDGKIAKGDVLVSATERRSVVVNMPGES